MGYTAQDIVDLLNSGQGTGSYQNVASEATNWTDTYKEQSDKFHQLLGKMEAAWVGDSGNAARGAVKPMSEASTVSADNLSKVSQNMETQSQSFVDLKGKVGDGPGPKPESTFASDYIPILSNRDEEISAWNEKAQKVVDAYNNYNTSSTDNATSLPSSYGTLSDGPEGLVFKPKSSGDGGTQRVEAPTVGGTGTSGAVGATGSGGPTTGSTAAPNLTSPTASGSGGGTGTGSGAGGVGGAAGGGIGGGAVGGPGLAGQDDRTTGAVPMDRRTRAAGFEAGGAGAAAASSGAGGSSSTGMGAGMVPPMAGAYGGAGGSDAAGRSGGGYGRGGGFGPGGGSGAGGSGGLGAGKGAGAMPGSGNASGAGGGQGAMGGAGKGMAAGMGRGGMGMGGMMGAGAGGRGSQGGDDDEHQDQYYVKQEMDPGLDVEQDEYGERLTDHTTGMLVVRPVIGEE